MSKWDKLLMRISNLSKDIRFDELRKVMESYGYKMNAPRSGSSHYTFRKPGCQPDRKSTRLNSSHDRQSRMPSSA